MPLAQEFKLWLILILVSVGIFFLDNLSLLNLPKQFALSVFAPIQYGFFQTGTKAKNQFDVLLYARSASQESHALKTQLSDLLLENSHLRSEINRLNSTVSQQLSLSPTTYNMVPSHSLGLSRYLIIDQGTEKGIRPGLPVVYKDFLLGVIKDSSINRATVILASDPDSKVAAFAANKDGKTKGILIGQFGEDMLLDKILHQEPVAPGDIIYTDGLDPLIPKGLVLGTVTEIFERDNQVFKQAKVKPIFETENLDIIFIITE